MFLDDLMRYRETQSAPLILAGEKRVKNMLQIFFGGIPIPLSRTST